LITAAGQSVVASDAAIEHASDERWVGNELLLPAKREELRRILIGDNRQDRIWVREGLEEGEWVVLERGPSLKDGNAVRIVSAAVNSGS